MAGLDPLSATKVDVLRRVEAHGFTTIYVGGDAKKPPYAYTVGLCAKAGEHREIIVFGLPQNVAIRILGIIGQRIINGEDMPLRQDIAQILEVYPVQFTAVSAKAFAEYGRVANWYAREILKRDRRVQALQLLWPDVSGKFPGNPGFAARHIQPLL